MEPLLKRSLDWCPTEKQLLALDSLEDDKTTELFFGGGAGGGKTTLGCAWLIFSCIRYPDTRWLIGRAVLKSIKDSTLLTLFELCKGWGMKAETDYFYRPGSGTISFPNGSAIYLKDLALNPSDPEFDKLGSTEFTGALIDEGSQISSKAKNIVVSRLRYRQEEYGLIPKLLVASNPTKNFLYYDFYKPWKENKLEPHRQFILALYTDNPYLPASYIENLKRMDKATRERLLFGNWEFDTDPSSLIDFEKIVDIFTLAKRPSEEQFLTVDIARFGTDKTVAFRWSGFHIAEVSVKEKKSIPETALFIDRDMAAKYGIPRSHIAIDEDGVGGGVVDALPGVRGFMGGRRQMENLRPGEPSRLNYLNLRAQCYFMLAEKINSAQISCYREIPETYKGLLIEDLEQVKQADPGSDKKLAIIPKDEIKQRLGRSPDFSDAMMMRMLFELVPKKRTPSVIGFGQEDGRPLINDHDSQFMDFIHSR